MLTAHNAAVADSSIVARIADTLTFRGLDSWHDPLLIAPVRHRFTDGTPMQTRMMAVEGSLRLWALREALFRREHPLLAAFRAVPECGDSCGDWNRDPITNLRRVLAEVRHDTDVQLQPSRGLLEDWADVLRPPATALDGRVQSWLYGEHRGQCAPS